MQQITIFLVLNLGLFRSGMFPQCNVAGWDPRAYTDTDHINTNASVSLCPSSGSTPKIGDIEAGINRGTIPAIPARNAWPDLYGGGLPWSLN